MSRRAGVAPPVVWSIQSVSVRVRDGPQRLARVYRLLLTGPAPGAPVAPVAAGKEDLHGSRDVSVQSPYGAGEAMAQRFR